MTVAALLFWFVVLVVAGSAIVVVTARNILHAAFSLCLAFLGVAAIYVFLHADFVAAVQLIVYVGGILVLILFAIMFSANVVEDTAEGGRSKLALAAGALGALAVFAAVVLMTTRLEKPLAIANTNASAPYQAAASVAAGQTGIGHCLMGQYLLPFEAVSVLLLAALVGAVVIIRKELR
jgi:NAD(P)H-quinone oxidoreductase subunit 6